MTSSRLKFLSEAKLRELRGSIASNIDRYVTRDFIDLERDNGWAIESRTVQVDVGALASLDEQVGAQAEIRNSIAVYQALHGMTPALAREERVWVRLTHVECLTYSRARWLAGRSGEQLREAIMKHMFAPGLTGIRDDNAISRLWWNMHIATIADPDDPIGALQLIAKTADIRQGFVERTGSASRRPLARAMIRAMRRDPWITSKQGPFRKFMTILNQHGGGVLFEALTDAEADAVIEKFAAAARAQIDVE